MRQAAILSERLTFSSGGNAKIQIEKRQNTD